MNELIENIEVEIESYGWESDSPLKDVNQETECKLIFDSVCEEIGSYYSKSGFKVSKRKIQLKFEDGRIGRSCDLSPPNEEKGGEPAHFCREQNQQTWSSQLSPVLRCGERQRQNFMRVY